MFRLLSKYLSLVFISLTILLSSCDKPTHSHKKPFVAKEQPVFIRNNRAENIASDDLAIHRLVFIGDAGQAEQGPPQKNLLNIAGRLSFQNTPETIVFLGDNIYDDGFQDKDTSCGNDSLSAQRLDVQLDIGRKSSNLSYFLPGNHDWSYHDEPDPKLILKQKNYIENCGSQAKYEPSKDGKLTTVSHIANNLYTLIFLDTQSIIHGSEQVFNDSIAQVKKIAEEAQGIQPIIITGHHTIGTYGPHGGCYQNDYFGSPLINFFRRNGISWGQDINDANYAKFIKAINQVIPKTKRAVFAGGHDHSLQVIKQAEGIKYSLVSGSGSKTSRTCDGEGTLFAQETLGYLEMVFHQSGKVAVNAVAFNERKGTLEDVYHLRMY